MAYTRSIRKGTTFMMSGMIILMFGLLFAINQTTIFDFSNIISAINLIEVLGIVLMLVGIMLFVRGFVITVACLIHNEMQDETRELIAVVLQAIDSIRLSATASGRSTSEQGTTCRYCGSLVGAEEIFCSSCGKAQR